MSLKTLLLLALVGVGFVVVARAEPPLTPEQIAAGEIAAVRDVSMYERFRYTVGSVGSAIIASTVRRSVLENQETLQELRASLHAAKGPDGIRVRSMARKINYLDSLSVQNLYQGHPIKAMRQSMESKSLLNSVRKNLVLGV
jgi:hypothetical protein